MSPEKGEKLVVKILYLPEFNVVLFSILISCSAGIGFVGIPIANALHLHRGSSRVM